MSNDRAFMIFAMTLVAGVLSVLTASVMAGMASVPTPVMFAEHLFFTVGFRAAYKALDGPGWWGWMPIEDAELEAAEAGHGAGHAAAA